MEREAMSEIPEIVSFIEQVRVDPRIGPMHVSVYTAIYCCWWQQGRNATAEFRGRELMSMAKIGGPAAFYRTIKQLHAYGYIRYEPSTVSMVKSRAWLVWDSAGK